MACPDARPSRPPWRPRPSSPLPWRLRPWCRSVLPYMEDEHAKLRAQDELPQSAGGKTITTTEPKFIPNEAASVVLSGEIPVSVRLIDCPAACVCLPFSAARSSRSPPPLRISRQSLPLPAWHCVGYMVEGAAGHMEEDMERMVKTPWFDYEIPFTQAAEIGTDKVMNDQAYRIRWRRWGIHTGRSPAACVCLPFSADRDGGGDDRGRVPADQQAEKLRGHEARIRQV